MGCARPWLAGLGAPTAATVARLNIVVITTDQQRWGGHGIARADCVLRTPYLYALAACGTCFDRAYSTWPACIPASWSLLTGLQPPGPPFRGGPPCRASLGGCGGAVDHEVAISYGWKCIW